jgi:hypothetical protein
MKTLLVGVVAFGICCGVLGQGAVACNLFAVTHGDPLNIKLIAGHGEPQCADLLDRASIDCSLFFDDGEHRRFASWTFEHAHYFGVYVEGGLQACYFLAVVSDAVCDWTMTGQGSDEWHSCSFQVAARAAANMTISVNGSSQLCHVSKVHDLAHNTELLNVTCAVTGHGTFGNMTVRMDVPGISQPAYYYVRSVNFISPTLTPNQLSNTAGGLSNTDSPLQNLSPGAIAGITIACVVCLLVVAVCVSICFCCCMCLNKYDPFKCPLKDCSFWYAKVLDTDPESRPESAVNKPKPANSSPNILAAGSYYRDEQVATHSITESRDAPVILERGVEPGMDVAVTPASVGPYTTVTSAATNTVSVAPSGTSQAPFSVEQAPTGGNQGSCNLALSSLNPTQHHEGLTSNFDDTTSVHKNADAGALVRRTISTQPLVGSRLHSVAIVPDLITAANGVTAGKSTAATENGSEDGIDGGGNVSQSLGLGLIVKACITAGASADMSDGSVSPRIVTLEDRKAAEDESLAITQTYSQLLKLLQDARIEVRRIKENLNNVETTRSVFPNFVIIQENLNAAYSLANKIRTACGEVLKQLRGTDKKGISSSALTEALEAASSCSVCIHTYFGPLQCKLREARDAAGSSEALWEMLHTAQAKADEIANTKIVESLQSALYDLDKLTQTPTHCQVEDSGETVAMSTPSTSIAPVTSITSPQLASSHRDSQTAFCSTPSLSRDFNNTVGGQSPAYLETSSIALGVEDDIDGPCQSHQLDNENGQHCVNDQSLNSLNDNTSESRSDGDVINNNYAIVNDSSDVSTTYEQHTESASRMGDPDGINTEADCTEIKKCTDT